MKPETCSLKFCLTIVSLTVFIVACGQPNPNRVNYRLPPARPVQIYHVGAQVSGLVFTDIHETTHPIEAYRGRVVVLEFWGSRCPYVEKSEKARRHLITQYSPRGVVYLAVDSNRDEYPEEIRQYLADHRSSYTVFADYESTASKRFNATRTPEAIVLDRDGFVRFTGSPFSPDQWAKPEPDRADWLEAALDAILAGRPPEPSMRPAGGSRIRPYRRL